MTKNKMLLLSGGSIALLGVLALQGCGSSGDDSAAAAGKAGATSSAGASSGGTSSGGTSAAGASSGGTSSAGTTSGGSTGEAGAAGEDSCVQFCADEGTTCTFGAATAAPYASNDACMTACATFSHASDSELPGGPTSGDTFACRRWHLTKAGNPITNVPVHCPHTGLLSKNAYADTTATGPCSGAAM